LLNETGRVASSLAVGGAEVLKLAEGLGLYNLRIAAETRCAQALLALGEPERALEPISSAVALLSDFGRVKALAFRRKLQRVLGLGRLNRGMD
jgi:hypothetical protein